MLTSGQWPPPPMPAMKNRQTEIEKINQTLSKFTNWRLPNDDVNSWTFRDWLKSFSSITELVKEKWEEIDRPRVLCFRHILNLSNSSASSLSEIIYVRTTTTVYSMSFHLEVERESLQRENCSCKTSANKTSNTSCENELEFNFRGSSPF